MPIRGGAHITARRPHARKEGYSVLGEVVQCQRPVNIETEAPPAGLDDVDEGTPILEPPAEKDESRLQVVIDLRQLHGSVEPNLLVREIDPVPLGVLTQNPPQDAAGDTLDQVLVVDQDAVVAAEMPDVALRG